MNSALTRHRMLLAVGAIAIPVLGVARLVFKPDYADSMAFRLLMGAAFVGSLVGSYRSERVREHLHAISITLVYVVHAWLLFYLAAEWGFDHDTVIGNVVGIAAMMTAIASWPELLVFLALNTLGTLYAYNVGPPDPFPGSVYLVMSTAVILAAGGGNVARSRLEGLLASANTELETRVAARTAALQEEVEQRSRAEAAAEQASRAKSVFLANMSHELRTPMNAIVGYTEMVRDELDDEGDNRVDDLDKALGAAGHLLGIIDDVLDLTRIEAGTLQLDVVDQVPLGEVVDEALQLVKPAADSRGNRLEFGGTDVHARTDRARVRQILVELLDNAARFTHKGEITVQVDHTTSGTTIEVSDTGVGIPEAALPFVFDRFKQVDDSSTRVHGGAGIGLALSRELALQLGGDISVSSQPGQGSTFTLVLP